MAAVRILSGILREVWVESVPLAGGTSRTITTGIRADARQLSRVQAFLFLQDIVGIPDISATLSVVGGFLTVTVVNAAIAGFTTKYSIDITLIHSVQQGVDRAAGGIVHVISSAASGALGTIPAATRVSQSAPGDQVRFVWSGGFDPRVGAGVPAPPGSIGICDDGSAAYLKADTADTAWIYLHDLSYYLSWLVAQSPVLQRLGGISFSTISPDDMNGALYLETVLRDVVWGRPLQMIFDCGVPADYADNETVVLALPVMPTRTPETATFAVKVSGAYAPVPGQIVVDLSTVAPGDRDMTAQKWRSAFYNDWAGNHFGNAYPIDSVTQQLTMYSAACGADLNDPLFAGYMGGTATGFHVVYQAGAASPLDTILTDVDALRTLLGRSAKTVNPQTGPTYQPTLDDAYEGGRQLTTLDNANPITVALPLETTVPFRATYTCPALPFVQKGAGKVTYVAEAGGSIVPAATPSHSGVDTEVRAVPVGGDVWRLIGFLGP